MKSIRESTRVKSHQSISKLLNFKKLFIFASLSLSPFLLYFNSLTSPFIFDDFGAIVNNPDIRHLDTIFPKLIYRPKSYYNHNQTARPLTYLTFSLNYQWGGLNPIGYHLFNLCLHWGVVLLFFFLTRAYLSFGHDLRTLQNREIRDWVLPWMVAMLFSVHPINVDVVAHVIHRSDSMASFFYILSILGFIKGTRQRRYYIGSYIAFLLSMAAKQLAVVLPLVILLLDYLWICRSNFKALKKRLLVHGIYWILLAAIFVSLILSAGDLGGDFGKINATWSRAHYAMTQLFIVLNYMKLLVFPSGQSLDHFIVPAVSLLDRRVLFAIVIWTGMLYGGWRLFRRSTDTKMILTACGLWMIINLLPTSSFMPIVNDAMAEKRLYLPAWGFLLAVSWFYIKLFKVDVDPHNTKKMMVLFSCHLFVLSFCTWKRNILYQSPQKIWQEVIALYPNDARAYVNLGDLYCSEKKFDLGIQAFKQAAEISPGFALAYINLGKTYSDLKQFDQALPCFYKAIEIEPNNALPYNHVGNIFYALGQYGRADPYYEKSIQLDPANEEALNNLGLISCSKKNYGQAKNYYTQSLVVNPEFYVAYYNLGNLYSTLDEPEQAIAQYRRALQFNPQCVEAYANLGNIYLKQKAYDLAQPLFLKAIQINPGFTVAYYNLGLTYYEEKQWDSVEQTCAIALQGEISDPALLAQLTRLKKAARQRSQH